MFGGLLKSTSRLALVAAAAVVGGVSAQAADLGGNCCADLEERVAELEATTARKGNRKVSLTVSGHVNKAIVWHDSEAADAHRDGSLTIQDNGASMSRFRFIGSAKVNSDVTAGYVMELGIQENAGTALNNSLIRQNHVFLTSASLGKVSLGQLSQATDAIYDITLANIGMVNLLGGPGHARLLGGNAGSYPAQLSGGRTQAIRYDSPTFGGLTFSASYGHVVATVADNVDVQNDTWDVALRYAGEISGFRLAAGIGYVETEIATNTRTDARVVGSGSIMHVATGLFVSGGAQSRDRDGVDVAGDDQVAYHGEAGIERNWFGIGRTTLYGEYGVTDLDIENATNADGTYFGLGLVQRVDAAATDLYLSFRQYDATNIANTAAVGDDTVNVVMGGMRISF